jgi:hypothetical protein
MAAIYYIFDGRQGHTHSGFTGGCVLCLAMGLLYVAYAAHDFANRAGLGVSGL